MKKVYGQSQSPQCVFCEKIAVTENEQKLPACILHQKEKLPDKRCSCGEYQDIKQSKYGAFFLCPSCGPRSLKKGLESAPENQGFKLNKKYRKEEKVYTIEELEAMWPDAS